MSMLRIFVACAAVLAACDDLQPATDDGGTRGPKVVVTDEGGGVSLTRVDARDKQAFVYLDLDQPGGAEVDASAGWDLRLQRYVLWLNGGTSGTGGVELAVLPGADFTAVTTAPSSGWITDALDDGGGDDPAFQRGDAWYLYDVANHTLTPRPAVYVVRTNEGKHVKLAFTSYYDAAGTPGYLTFRSAVVAAPTGDDLVDVDASGSAWVYVRLGSGVVSAPADPATSTDWDLAFQGPLIRTNGGASGAGHGAARVATAAYGALTSTDTVGFTTDTTLPLPGPPGTGETPGNAVLAGWYAYDQATHTISPKDVVFVIRGPSGTYGKLQIAAYADGKYRVRVAAIGRAIATHATMIDAPSASAWVPFRFDGGTQAAPAAMLTGLDWDIAFRQTRVATNGGTSGPGQAAAADPLVATLDEIASGTMSALSSDEMVPEHGPPGSGSFSGNAVLDGWFAYDATTHLVSPAPKAFVVRTSDGAYAKLRITAFDAATHRYTFDWAYAGPGRDDF